MLVILLGLLEYRTTGSNESVFVNNESVLVNDAWKAFLFRLSDSLLRLGGRLLVLLLGLVGDCLGDDDLPDPEWTDKLRVEELLLQVVVGRGLHS